MYFILPDVKNLGYLLDKGSLAQFSAVWYLFETELVIHFLLPSDCWRDLGEGVTMIPRARSSQKNTQGRRVSFQTLKFL